MPLSPRAAGLAPRVTGDGRYGKSGIAAQGHLIHGMAISQSSPAVTLSGHPRQLAWKMRTMNPAPRVIDYAVASGANVYAHGHRPRGTGASTLPSGSGACMRRGRRYRYGSTSIRRVLLGLVCGLRPLPDLSDDGWP